MAPRTHDRLVEGRGPDAHRRQLGGQGLHPRGNFNGFLYASSEQKWLEAHGDTHWTHFYSAYGRDVQKRFFDHFLKGVVNGWERTPRVQLNIRHPGERFVWRGENEWPLARTEWTQMHLHSDLALRREPVEAATSIDYEALGDGPLFLVVRVFDPEDSEVVFQGALDPHTPVAQGWLRASHRILDETLSEPWRPYHSHDESQPLQPGETYELEIEIWPTCAVVPAGCRVALTVRGKDYEYPGGGARLASFVNVMRGCGPFLHDDPNDRPPDTFGGTTTVRTGGDRRSFVVLPVIPTQPDDG